MEEQKSSGKMKETCYLFNTFTDPSLEKLYQSFSVKQKRAGLECFLLTAILFDIYMLVVPSGQDLWIFGFMSLFLTINSCILIWCKKGFESKLLWAAVPHLSWHVANAQVLVALFLKKNEVTSRDSLGWVLLLDYLIYVTLPIRLRYIIILSLGTCASYIAALIGLSKSGLHFYQQDEMRAKLQPKLKVIVPPKMGTEVDQSLPSTSRPQSRMDSRNTSSLDSRPGCSTDSVPRSGMDMSYDMTSTPRKRKLSRSLHKAVQVSKERKKKLASIRRKLLRREKRIANMKDIMFELKKKNYMQEEYLDVLTRLGGPQELYIRQIKKSKRKSLPSKYTEELRKFALTLHYYSPAAYEYVRRTFNTCLPHVRTLSRWYEGIDGMPGFTKEAFEALRLKMNAEENKLLCGLIIDEMSIRQHEEWVPGKDRCYGYVDMGTGAKECTLATNAFVFLITCINGNWKLPVGYFLIAGITGEQKKGLVIQCLEKCHEVGITIVSLTCDGPPVNLTMARQLGCILDHRKLNSCFKHPSTNEDVYFFLDPSHMVKLIRNTLGEKGSLVDNNNDLISWHYFKELHNLQESESFHLSNKLRSQHIAFWKQKMKVRLATQVFSESVANALSFCDQMKLEQFQGVSATVNFTLILNNIFDILNSRNFKQVGYKKPINKVNYSQIQTYLDMVDNYLSNLKTNKNGMLILDTDRHTGFLGLKVCIFSLKAFYNKFIDTDILKFFPVHKIIQDHLELFFGTIRSHGGHNNNPTARQFQSAYKKTLCHLELRESFRGNCVPLEQLRILNCNPVKLINLSCRDYRIVENINDDDTSLVDHDYLPNNLNLSEFSKQVIAYLGGYVVHILKKSLICEECVNVLVSVNRRLNVFSFISKKEKKNLEYPSSDVIDICSKCETIIKTRFKDSSDFSLQYVVNLVLKEFMYSNIFSDLLPHSVDQSPLENHRVLLIKAVANKYTNVRLYYLSKNKIDKSLSTRHHSNKITLFKGQ